MRPWLILPLALTFCQKDETLAGYADQRAIYTLQMINDDQFPARVTLTLPKRGRIAGEGPCNTYSARLTVPYPWFAVKDLTTTRRGCPELALETLYLDTVRSMTLVEVSGNTLILSNDAGDEMTFKAE